ncbi:glycosyltransferase family 4 protein [Nitrospirillum amazonense]|uniref:Glycosyltransferase involved in cell wall biosynthesis n=1 Tax=Nitrospirillum amazonense TaxID=28077 RepID=A0A560K9J0_9PROT|nr:glycosyltransferase family 4 protein [Nitrospirillum amazonense]MDG3441580.1 glycosyltransferase family 4 protein [Nitrospirillum amazonense]TWB79927.1 glycosyltransferase involved in cell wall biosynthesis [Nitrospirillum amazonense]
MPDAPRPTLLFVVTEDWYFRSHRLPTARAARDAGFDVAVACRVAKDGPAIAAEGFRVIALPWRRGSFNPLNALGDIRRLARLYRRERPTIIHHIAVKPTVLGGFALFLAGLRDTRVVATLAGLGLGLSGTGTKAGLGRVLLRLALNAAGWRRSQALVVQNGDDAALLAAGWPRPPTARLIRGSGVDLTHYEELAEPLGPVTCAQVSRMLTLKGVEDLVAAVRLVRAQGIDLHLILAGAPDTDSPAAIPRATLDAWAVESGIEWLGAVSDVRTVWARASIAVLASRGGEGVPKSLLEAAACGRAIVATDVPGSREVAVEGRNALLAPPRDPAALAAALARLAQDAALRRRLGLASRGVVDPEFGEAEVGRRMRDLYLGLVTPLPVPRRDGGR